MNDRIPAEQVRKLTLAYSRIFNLCYDALAPGKTQIERNRMRDALKEYLDPQQPAPKNIAE